MGEMKKRKEPEGGRGPDSQVGRGKDGGKQRKMFQ